jgi:hypothetical protein
MINIGITAVAVGWAKARSAVDSFEENRVGFALLSPPY